MHTLAGTLILLSTLFLSVQASGDELSGVVSQIRTERGREVVDFRSGAADHVLDLSKLPKETQDILRSPDSRKNIVSFPMPAEAMLKTTPTPYGIRPDCRELPMSEEKLDAILTSPKVNNIIDFLKAMPKGTMQGFTLITTSLSAQAGEGESKVSPKEPRVLRSTADGKITLSYTCNPESKAYGTVEVLISENGELRGKSYKLDKPADSVGAGMRVDPTPTSCFTCHSTGVPIGGKLSMKHNWPSYFFWSDCKVGRGITMYGSSDDNMGPGVYRPRDNNTPNKNDKCTAAQDRAANDQEKRDFEAFKKLQKDNPCYNLLPWANMEGAPRGGPRTYEYYPYAKNAGALRIGPDRTGRSDYALRTNLRFTDNYSHHNAQRLSKLIQQSPDYEKMKYFLTMETAGCLRPSDLETMNKLVPRLNLKPGEFKTGAAFQGPDPRKSNPLLFKFAQLAGIRPADWSLEYRPGDRDYSDPTYVQSIVNDPQRLGDLGIPAVVAGNLLQNQANGDPALATAAAGVITRGIGKSFGPEFSCIDDLGGGIRDSARGGNGPLCRALRLKNDAHVVVELAKLRDCPQPGPEKSEIATIAKEVEQIKQYLDSDEVQKTAASIERGRKLVQDPDGRGHCIECHSRTKENMEKRPPEFLFVPDEKMSPAEQTKSLSAYRQRLSEGMSVSDWVNSGNMPYDKTVLNDQERKDVIAYMKSLGSATAPPAQAGVNF